VSGCILIKGHLMSESRESNPFLQFPCILRTPTIKSSAISFSGYLCSIHIAVVQPVDETCQIPRYLISDAHEWINEIPIVLIYFLAKPLPGERAWKN